MSVDRDGVDRSFAAFVRDYVDGPKNEDGIDTVLLDIDIEKWRAENNGVAPNIIVRSGDHIAVLNLIPLGTYLDIDVYAYHKGEQGAAGVMGMNLGYSVPGFKVEDTPFTTGPKTPGCRMVAVFVGEAKGTEKTE